MLISLVETTMLKMLSDLLLGFDNKVTQMSQDSTFSSIDTVDYDTLLSKVKGPNGEHLY